MTTRKQAIEGGIWSALQSIGGQVVGMAFFLALAYLLAPRDFGVVAFAGVVIAFGEIILDLGLTQALIQADELSSLEKNSTFWTLFIVGGGLFGGTALGATLVPDGWMSASLTPIIQVMALSFLFVNTASTFRAQLKREMDFRAIALSSFAAVLTAGVIGVGMAWYGFGAWSLVAREVIYDFVEMVGLMVSSDWSPGWSLSWSAMEDLLGFGRGMVGTRVAGFLRRQSDDFIIGLLLGPSALGLYSMAYRLYLALRRLLHRTVNQVSFAAFSSVQDDAEKLRNGYLSAFRMAVLMAVPIFAMVALLHPEIISTFFPVKWSESAPLLAIFCLVGAVDSFSLGADSILLALGHSWIKMGMNLANAFLNVMAYAIGATWGIYGVALAFLVSQAVYQVIPLTLVHNKLDFAWSEFNRRWLGPMGAVLGAVVLTLLINTSTGLPAVVGLMIGVTVFGTSYLALLWWVDPDGVRDIGRVTDSVIQLDWLTS